MPKGSPELTSARKAEIVAACEQLYQTVSFKEITLKEIGAVTSFTRTSIYNYFQTKEEIFLEILKNEYVLWIAELEEIRTENECLTPQQFAQKTADSLEHRPQLLKILSMNLYDIEANSRMENLVEFKAMYHSTVKAVNACTAKFFPKSTAEEREILIYQFFPFVYGIYPYTFITEKQKTAMEKVGFEYKPSSVSTLAYNCLIRLVSGLTQ